MIGRDTPSNASGMPPLLLSCHSISFGVIFCQEVWKRIRWVGLCLDRSLFYVKAYSLFSQNANDGNYVF